MINVSASIPNNSREYKFSDFGNFDKVERLLKGREYVVLPNKRDIQKYRQKVELTADDFIFMSSQDADFWIFPYGGDFDEDDLGFIDPLPEKHLLCWKAGMYTKIPKKGKTELLYLDNDEIRDFYDNLRRRGVNPEKVKPVEIRIMVTDVTPGHIADNILEIYDISQESDEEPHIKIKKYIGARHEPPKTTVTDKCGYAIWRLIDSDVKIVAGKPQDSKKGGWLGYLFFDEPRSILERGHRGVWNSTSVVEIGGLVDKQEKLREKLGKTESIMKAVNGFDLPKEEDNQ